MIKKQMVRVLPTFAAILWITVFPLVTGGSYASITTAKWQLCLALTAVTIALTLIPALLEKKPPDCSASVLPFLLMLIWMAVSAFCSPYADVSNAAGELIVWFGNQRHEGLLAKAVYVLIFLCMSIRPVRLRFALKTAAVSVMLFVLAALVQYTGLNVLGLFPQGLTIKEHYEFQSTIGNIDLDAAWLSLIVLVLWSCYLTEKSGGELYAAGAMAGTFMLFLMEVESGLLVLLLYLLYVLGWMANKPAVRSKGCMVFALVFMTMAVRKSILLPWFDGTENVAWAGCSPMLPWLAFAAVPLLAKKHLGKLPSVSRKQLLIIALAAVILSIGAVYAYPAQPEQGTVYELHEMLHGHMEAWFGHYRPAVWQETLRMIGDGRAWLGTGPDTFWYAFTEHLAEHPLPLPSLFDHPHNEYLALAANTGIPSLVLYLAGIGMVIAALCRKKPDVKHILLPGILGYSVSLLFGFSICLTSPMFWCMLGLAVNKQEVNDL